MLPEVCLLAYATSVEVNDRDIKRLDGTPTSFKGLLLNGDQKVSLEIKDRDLTSIPQELLQIKNIDYLDLEKNNITVLPDELTELYNLEQLNFTDNNIRVLPATFGKFRALKILRIKQNELDISQRDIQTSKPRNSGP